MNNFSKKIFSPERIFLVDGLGAAYSATMLGVILAAFVPFFGMPTTVLYPLAGAASLLAIYSLTCHFLQPARWQIFLRGIAALNLSYCIASIIIMGLYWSSLTIWGILYFVSEKMVVLTLVGAEFYISSFKEQR
jgi:hypothetical protein